VATSLDKDFILLAGGGWALSSSETLSLSFGDSLGSVNNKISTRHHYSDTIGNAKIALL